jgi:hypothetical protein
MRDAAVTGRLTAFVRSYYSMSAREEHAMGDEGMTDSQIVDSRMVDEIPLVEDFADDLVDTDIAEETTAEASARSPRPPSQRPPAEPPQPAALTERDRQILEFERQWWRHAGAKEQAIRDTFGVSSTRYYQILNRLLDNPAALAHDPVVVGRLRRLRSTRSRSRGTGRVA